ncbi:E3 ubiquitin-protein ligase Topors-like [Numida meleagris]|uniref:E3 ubiquitin-protein ligase Topors-like n=1 Tax=Numida meleagris TaxID=8996 RepID=UPI000B3DC02E|nr:E3 ubiquitin-protein ligase Topors-like [Numida meleagris]XP_021236505.1 E3 ubiquitin-protein ligase Topors-like [Numida meleagris]
MATELDHRCPICLDTMDDTSYVMTCLHQFCFGCIRRWTETVPKCPLCKQRVRSILHSVRADDSFIEFVVRRPVQARRVRRHRPEAAAQVSMASTWASIFRRHPVVLWPLLPWLRWGLRQLFGADNRAASAALRLVLSSLLIFGLDEDALTRQLLSSLQSQVTSFVRQLIARAMQWCSREVRRLLGLEASHAATGQEGSAAAAPGAAASPEETPDPSPQPSSSTEETNVEELPVTSTSALSEDPSQPPSIPAPVPTVQEAAQEERGEAAAGPSTASTARELSRRAPRRAPKRRAGTCEASAPSAKRPARRQR